MDAALCGMTEVLGKDGPVKVSDLVSGKTCVGLYFSAHWCPPCRGFTPILAQFYKDLKANDQSIEIIFVSSDRDEESFKSYYDEMPWHALAFSERDIKNALAQKYGVQGIPTLIILDKDGNIKDKNARGTAQSAQGSKELPAAWK
ncbi:nucleoredoxin-like isoform X2 [Saccostrea cucullata]|uniref:nucleoredoxin-like isoform X2 n=1 Tax=Saccostrea cuccullata TaxID=36930 RepID=UPI002ED0CC7B